MNKSSAAPHGRLARSWRIFLSGTGRLATALLAAGLIGACSDRERIAGLENLPPDVAFDPATKPLTGESGSTHAVSWTANDPDGRVDHYRVALNPESMDPDDPAWEHSTLRSRSIVAARRTGIGAAQPVVTRAARDPFDVLAVVAVDDRGARSEPAVRVFFEDNVAPVVSIMSPIPTAIINQALPPSFTIRWQGNDPDGAGIANYRYILLEEDGPFPIPIAISNPDSLRRFYAPDFEGWTQVPGTTTQASLANLEIGRVYVFAVTGFDADGAYDPVFNLNKNVLRFRVVPPEGLGPRLTVWSAGLHFTQTAGSASGSTIDLDVAAGQPVQIFWSAVPRFGGTIDGYRWALDPKNLDKELKRPRAGNDLHHWRPWSLETTSATVGPFADDGQVHEFVVEARDELHLTSRVTVRLHPFGYTPNRDLLIVDDTRLRPDQAAAGGCVQLPIGSWPTAAELDSFLFARGGVPWRCYPAGTMSSPGLFAGYSFDTIGTRTGQLDPTVPLSTLSQYRNIVWITDATGATFNRPASDPLEPITSLRYMSAPGRSNTLAAFSAAGGRVWAMGATAMASLMPWNNPAGMNNDQGGITFSNAIDELVPGRFMYDAAHWRSEIKVVTVTQGFISRFLGRHPAPDPANGVPDYTLLPNQMRPKSPATDPFPPGRAGQPPTVFYSGTIAAEFLSLHNFVLENGASVVDSLYELVTFQLPPAPGVRRITMTHYHGNETGPVMMTGFEPWRFARADAQALVDVVLRDSWGLVKSAPSEQLVRAQPRTP